MHDNETRRNGTDSGPEMNEQSRESLMSAAFVKLADTLIDDFDMVDLLHTLLDECIRIVDTQAGGLMLADSRGRLELVASTSDEANLVEVMQLNAGAGPCVDCYNGGSPVVVADIEAEGNRWPDFRREALAQGFHSVYAVPMRLRGKTIGTLNLLGTTVGSLSERDAEAVQALADAATIGILQERLVRENTIATEQLSRALTSRIFIEQAKGVLSESQSISIDAAFILIRQYARDTGRPLHAVAEAVANRTLTISRPTRS